MTLQELCRQLGQMAKAQKLIRFSAAGASLGELNPIQLEWYPFIFIIPSGTHTVTDDTTRFDLTIYYCDRLLEDDTNELDVMSAAIENLKNILVGARLLEGVVDVENTYTIRNFMPTKQNDRLAGAYAQVRITVANNTICFVPGDEPEE